MPAPATSRSPTPPSTKRLLHELASYPHDPNPTLLHLGPVNESEILHWEAVMKGVDGTAYEHGLWKLSIHIPENYPLAPPAIRFLTPVCHPNIHFKTGEICLDLLKTSWSPAYTVSSTLSSIHQLLSYPAPESPLNLDVAALYRAGDMVGAEGLVRWCCGEWRWEGN
ncbi:hypothetical protein MMC20_005653 [Loxospora ochrophaea]|nr:hypothetical protein [Loxospora ochrophaea]